MNMNLEKEYLKGNNIKLTVARIFTAAMIIICVFYSIGISGWGTLEPELPDQGKYYADPDLVQGSVYDPRGVLKNTTLNSIRNINLTLMEQYNVRVLVALIDQSDLAGRDVEDYTVALFDGENLGWNDTLMVIVSDGQYWIEFGRGIYNHAISDANYDEVYFDMLEKYIVDEDYDGAAALQVDRTRKMYENYDALTRELSYSSYGSYSYDYASNLFGLIFVMAVIIFVVGIIAAAGGRGRRYKYVTYYPHRRIFRPNNYNFYRYQNRHNIHHTRGGFWGPGAHGMWSHPNNNTWRNNKPGGNNSGGGFGNKSGQSNWSSGNKPSGWSSNSSGRTNSGGGFGRSSGGRTNSGGGFGRSSGSGGRSGGGFGRKK